VVAEKSLMDEMGGVTVDYVKTSWSEGFAVKPGNAPAGGNSCGSCSC
jgi:Fe-S cluster assembly iron-binding protein IscA